MTIQTYPAPKSQVTSSFWRYTATGGETTLTGTDNAGVALAYLPGQEQVFLNGVLQVRGTDYTATNGTSIAGLASLTAGDYVQVTTYSNFTINQVPASSLQGSILNLQLANSSFTIGSTLINLGDTKSTIAGLTLTAPTINNPIVGTGYSTSVPLTVKGATGQAVNSLEVQDSSSNKLFVIDQSGNTGIKYSSPAASLHVQKTGSQLQTVAIFDNGQSTGTTGAPDAIKIGFANNGSIKGSINVGTYGYDYIGFNTGTDTERVRIDAAGNLGVGTTTPNTYNVNQTYNKVLSLKAPGDQVLTLGSYWQSGVGQNSYINSSQSTSATNASNLIIQTGQVEAMRVDTSQNVMIGTTAPVGKLTVGGSLSVTNFSADYTLTDSTARTYNANTWYTLPGTLARPVAGAGSYYLQLFVQYDAYSWHAMAAAGVLGIVQWKYSGTTPTITVPMDAHAQDSINVSIRSEVGNGTSQISVNFSSAVTVSTGGFVQILAKRMF
jgi:hypothetical protein